MFFFEAGKSKPECSLRRRRSKPSLYKGFRRVRGPAATQAKRSAAD